jgi:hypothetical protein
VIYHVTSMYSGTSVHERLSSQTNWFTNKFSEKMNSVLSNDHASQQQRLATSWEYRWASVSCCVTFAQYTSLLEFAMPSLEFHCVLWFFYILLNKTPWDQRSFSLWTFRVMNGLQEWIKFVNRGSTVFSFWIQVIWLTCMYRYIMCICVLMACAGNCCYLVRSIWWHWETGSAHEWCECGAEYVLWIQSKCLAPGEC